MNQIDPVTLQVLLFIETLLCKWHLENIRKRQDKLKRLTQDENRFLAVWNGEHLPSCKSCLSGKWTQMRTTNRCNFKCDFCCQDANDQKTVILSKNRYKVGSSPVPITEDEVKEIFDRQGDLIDGVAWLQYEPLLEMDKILDIMSYIASKNKHQWLYTNGVFATVDNLKLLRDNGLNEIRFNLQASNFSDEVIGNMKKAKKYIDLVGIETPFFSKTLENFREKKQNILDTGLDFINTPELQVFGNNYQYWFEKEGIVYRHRLGYVSPLSSRHYVYDLIEMAEGEKWNVIINDCSNETKFYRGISTKAGFASILYNTYMMLPQESFMFALEKVLKHEKYEIF